MVTRPNGHLYMSFGVMGGFMQPQGQIQVLLNHLFFNMTPQEALNAPRFCINAIDNSSSCSSSSSTHILLEEGIQESCMGELIGLGHDRVEMKVGDTNREVFGRGQMIILKDTAAHKGEMLGGSDPRGDGFVGMID